MRHGIFLAVALLLSTAAHAQIRHLNFEAFGDVSIYGVPGQSGRLTIIIGDASVAPPARDALGELIATQGGLAAVVDYGRYADAMSRHPETCTYNSWEFEKLSKFIQKTMELPRYEPPILAGLGAGAALAYTTFNEAPRGTFAGLMASGLCRSFAMPKELCAGEDETWSRTASESTGQLESVDQTEDPWVALPSAPAGSCLASATTDFFSPIDGADVLPATKASWGAPQWQSEIAQAVAKARAKVAERKTQAADLADLPLHEELARAQSKPPASKTMAIILTGDGGWAGLDRDLADKLAESGVNVVGLNSLQFFWKKRTPDETAEALSRIINHYTQLWRAENVLLIGYSFGADVLPFAVRRLPEDDMRRVKGVALLAPGFKADFEFRVGDWLGMDDDPKALPILPEILAMPAVPVLCAYGSEEEDEGATSCPKVPASRARAYKTEGGHHFDGDFAAMTRAILGLVPTQLKSGI